MGQHRQYQTGAQRQRAYRQRQRQHALAAYPVVQVGDCVLYQGDALTLVPLLASYTHCITDPPYEAEAHIRTRRTRAVLEGRSPYAAIDFAPITEQERRLFAGMRCGWILLFCQVEAVGRYQQLLGEKYKRAVTWEKPDSAPQFTGDRPAMGTESIVCAWGQPGRCTWNAGGKRGVYRHLIRDGEARIHPTQKPVALMAELVRDFTQPGDIVLDPFMGSASTGVACIQEQRRFIGIERDPATFSLACQRIEAAARQCHLFVAPQRPPSQGAIFR